jgi:hypothetical protein
MTKTGSSHCQSSRVQALSNQKLAEMRLRFGVDRAGLQTGDGSLNIGGALHRPHPAAALPHASSVHKQIHPALQPALKPFAGNADSEVVVMTTEILRNIMYRQADTERNPEREDRLATVGLVVLDEVSQSQCCAVPCSS